jgi:hypothetical protein
MRDESDSSVAHLPRRKFLPRLGGILAGLGLVFVGSPAVLRADCAPCDSWFDQCAIDRSNYVDECLENCHSCCTWPEWIQNCFMPCNIGGDEVQAECEERAACECCCCECGDSECCTEGCGVR